MIYHQQFCSQDIKDEFPCTVGAVRTKPLAPFHTRAVTTPATTPLETAASYALLELRGYLHRSEPEIWRNVMAWNVMCTCIHICPYIYIYIYICIYIPVQIGPEGLGAPFCSYRTASPRCPSYKLAEPNVHRGRFLLQNGSPS